MVQFVVLEMHIFDTRDQYGTSVSTKPTKLPCYLHCLQLPTCWDEQNDSNFQIDVGPIRTTCSHSQSTKFRSKLGMLADADLVQDVKLEQLRDKDGQVVINKTTGEAVLSTSHICGVQVSEIKSCFSRVVKDQADQCDVL